MYRGTDVLWVMPRGNPGAKAVPKPGASIMFTQASKAAGIGNDGDHHRSQLGGLPIHRLWATASQPCNNFKSKGTLMFCQRRYTLPGLLTVWRAVPYPKAGARVRLFLMPGRGSARTTIATGDNWVLVIPATSPGSKGTSRLPGPESLSSWPLACPCLQPACGELFAWRALSLLGPWCLY